MTILQVIRNSYFREVARRAGNPKARFDAASRITDDTMLAQIAATDLETWVRESVTKRIDNVDVLVKLELTDPNSDESKAAYQRLLEIAEKYLPANQMELHKWASGHQSPAVRKAAVSRVSDQSVLAQCAKNDDNAFVREAATKRLTTPSVLADLALNDSNWSVRVCAVRRVTHQHVLAEAVRDSSEWVRRYAVENLGDMELVASLAKGDPSVHVRKAAVERVSDQATLAFAARNEVDDSTRNIAISRLDDQALLAEIARNSGEKSWHRQAAIRRLTDRRVVESLLSSAESDVRATVDYILGELRKQELSKMNDINGLWSAIKEAPNEIERDQAVRSYIRLIPETDWVQAVDKLILALAGHEQYRPSLEERHNFRVWQLPDPAIDHLLTRLATSTGVETSAVIRMLIWLNNKKAVEPIASIAVDRSASFEVRQAAVLALGHFQDSAKSSDRATSTLLKFLAEEARDLPFVTNDMRLADTAARVLVAPWPDWRDLAKLAMRSPECTGARSALTKLIKSYDSRTDRMRSYFRRGAPLGNCPHAFETKELKRGLCFVCEEPIVSKAASNESPFGVSVTALECALCDYKVHMKCRHVIHI